MLSCQTTNLLRATACAAVAVAFAIPVAAQCSTQWRTDGPFNTVSAQVWSMAAWDADGAGPLTAQIVAGRGSGGSGAVVQWDEQSASWTTLGITNGRPLCMLAASNGDLLVGGEFTTINGVTVNRLARFDGTTWSSVGGGVTFSTFAAYVYALTELPNGDFVVGGFFTAAGGNAISHIARWDGANWSSFGTGANGDVRAFAQLPGGDLIAGGSFSQMGGVMASKVARWNGSAWSPLGSGLPITVRDFAVRADGSLIAANADTYVWDGTTWSLVAGNLDYQTSVVALPDGDIVTGGISGSLKRFDATTWTPIGPATAGACNDLLVLPDGDVAAAGQFFGAGGAALPSVMGLTTTCEASVADLGGACQGAITASLPWAGGVVETVGSGLPASSIVVVVHGFSPVSVGLDAVFATGVPGCVLQAAPDVLGVLLPNGSSASSTLALPDNPAVAGVQLREQWVTFELTPTFDFGPIRATNTLNFTVGAF
ncbi:MAG: hypothetical protein R3F29_14820 [Planctomycetota bacterium]